MSASSLVISRRPYLPYKSHIEYLGLVISENRVKISPVKIVRVYN